MPLPCYRSFKIVSVAVAAMGLAGASPAAAAALGEAPVAPPRAAPAGAAGVRGFGGHVTTGGWSVEYDGFAHGLLVLKMRASLRLKPDGYEGTLNFHTAGMVGWMVHDTDASEVQGRFLPATPGGGADQADPAHFVSIGNLRGTDRVTRMSYRDGVPVIETLTPDPKLERAPVPPAVTPHTLDNLSALAEMVRQVADTGSCEGRATLFDGRRLITLAARTAGMQTLPHTSRSIFSGTALRCDVDGNQTYGFKNDESQAEQAATKHGNAWLAPMLPQAPLVPVRVIFTNKVLGEVTLYLTAAQALPGAVAQLPSPGSP